MTDQLSGINKLMLDLEKTHCIQRRKNAFLLLAGERMGRRGGEKRLESVNAGKEMGRTKAKKGRKENGWMELEKDQRKRKECKK